MNKGTPWLPFFVAFGSLLIQFATVVWWGRGIDTKVKEHDEYIAEQKKVDRQNSVDLAVMKTDVTNIAKTVERIETKLDVKTR